MSDIGISKINQLLLSPTLQTCQLFRCIKKLINTEKCSMKAINQYRNTIYHFNIHHIYDSFSDKAFVVTILADSPMCIIALTAETPIQYGVFLYQ